MQYTAYNILTLAYLYTYLFIYVCMHQKKKISASKKLLPILNEMRDQLRIDIKYPII